MKNVNKFYLFSGEKPVDLKSLYNFTDNDFELTEDIAKPFSLVDLGKAEAGIIKIS